MSSQHELPASAGERDFDSVEARLEMHALLAAIATRFIAIDAQRIDDAVEQALAAIGRFANADRVGLALFDERHERWSINHEWHAPSLWSVRGLQEHVAPFHWAMPRLIAGERLEVLRIDTLPREAASEAMLLRGLGLGAVLTMPMQSHERVVGFASLGTIAPRNRPWPAALQELLALPARMMAHALERRRTEERLHDSQARWNSLSNSNVVGVLSTSMEDGTVIASNDAGLRLLGRSRDELQRGEIDWRNTTPEEEMANDLKMFDILVRTGRVMPWEKHVLRPDGSRVPTLLSMTSLVPHADEILTVAIDLSSRRQVAEELKRRDDIDRLQAALSRRLLDLSGEDIEDAVREAIGAVARQFGFAGVVIFDCDTDAEHAVRRTWWSGHPGRGPEPELRIALTQRSWLRERLRTGRITRVGSVAELPESARAERAAMERFGLQAGLSVPLMPGGKLRGFLFFFAARAMQVPEDMLATLRVFGDIIANALERLRIDRDIAEAVATLEHRVDLRLRQLEASNEELESFAYSVSHDLRAPLRTIDGLSQVLREDYAAELGENAVRLLVRMQGATQRMGHLIDGLLQLSRVVRTPMEWQEVNLSDLAEGIADEKRRSMPDRQVEVRVAPGICVTGHARLLRAALEQLLDNAFKFTGLREDGAIIEMDAAVEDGCTLVRVRDNGVGFDPEFAEKLFGAFQRLHGLEQFEGHGIGLAVVERVVRMHGGSAVADGRPGAGATIALRFPDARRPA